MVFDKESCLNEILDELSKDDYDEYRVKEIIFNYYGYDFELGINDIFDLLIVDDEKAYNFFIMFCEEDFAYKLFNKANDNLKEKIIKYIYDNEIGYYYQQFEDFEDTKESIFNYLKKYNYLLFFSILEYLNIKIDVEENKSFAITVFEDILNNIRRILVFLSKNTNIDFEEIEDDFEFNYIESEKNSILDKLEDFWKKCSKEFQSLNFYELLKAYSFNREYCLRDCILESKKEIVLKNLNKIIEVVGYCQDITEEEKKDTMMEKAKNGEPIEFIWNSLDNTDQEKLFQELIKTIKDKETLNKIWNNTCQNITIKEENIRLILEKYIRYENDDIQLEAILEKYMGILSINKELNSNIIFQILSCDIINRLNFEQLAKITCYSEIQEKILNAINYDYQERLFFLKSKANEKIINENKLKEKIIEICIEKYDLNTLDKILENINKIQLPNLDEENLECEEIIKSLINAIMLSEDYFDVSFFYENIKFGKYNQKDLTFNHWRLIICECIIYDDIKNLKKFAPNILTYLDNKEQKCFALLQIKYGIDINDAKILVQKYSKGLHSILELNDEDRKIKDIILDIEKIINLNDEQIRQIYDDLNNSDFDFSKNLDNALVITELEKKCISIFTKNYEKSLYKLEDNEPTHEVEFEGKKIKCYTPKEDFNMFVRSEGAYSFNWKEPDNYENYLNMSRISYHGNCESFICQNLIALARPKGPIFGYSDCNANNLLLMAPYDLVSNKANTSFSTINGDKTDRGVCFLPPKEMIDSTRHGHNEVVFERNSFEGNKIKKRLPNYVVWIKESNDEDIEKDEELKKRWESTKKAASQLNIPIVIIDREYFAEKEKIKIQKMFEILSGKSENYLEMSRIEIMREIIVQFENNVTGLRFANESIKNKYFTDIDRENNIKRILENIRMKKENNYKEYRTELIELYSILDNESLKKYSITGKEVNFSSEIEDYYSIIKKEIKDEIDSSTLKPKNVLKQALTEEKLNLHVNDEIIMPKKEEKKISDD